MEEGLEFGVQLAAVDVLGWWCSAVLGLAICLLVESVGGIKVICDREECVLDP